MSDESGKYNYICEIHGSIENQLLDIKNKKDSELERQRSVDRKKAIILLIIMSIFAIVCIILILALVDASGLVDSKTVYITDTGKCYHSSNCISLRKSHYSISLGSARASGYSSCGLCGGGSSGSHIFFFVVIIATILAVIIYFNIYYKLIKRNEERIVTSYNNQVSTLKTNAKNQIFEMIARENSVREICGIPNDVFMINGLPQSTKQNFYSYVKDSRPTVYHDNPRCGGAYLQKVHNYICIGLAPCKRCMPPNISVPTWFMMYKQLYEIVKKYDIDIDMDNI